MDSTYAPLRCTCAMLTAGTCEACKPAPQQHRRCPMCGCGDTVMLSVTVPIEEAMKRVAEVIREFAEKEAGPVRERLGQIAEAVDGTR